MRTALSSLLALPVKFYRYFISPLLQQGGGQVEQVAEGPIEASPEEEERVLFVSFVLDDVQATWPKSMRSSRYSASTPTSWPSVPPSP